MRGRARGAVAAALMFVAPISAGAEDGRVAWLQARTIFNSGLRSDHVVALTFDDGPNARTLDVLNVLKAYNVKATFFVVGRMARLHPEILARIAADGHLLANHGASHVPLTRTYDEHPDRLLDQLREVNAEIAPYMKPRDRLYFRAPFGVWRREHAEILNADPVLRNYVGPIFWDVGGGMSKTADGYVMSSSDWECWKAKWSPKTCAKGYLREIRRKNGGVVLMHCIHAQSAELVRDVVPALVEEGYSFARLDQIPAYRQYDTPPATPVVASAASLAAVSIASEALLK
ncbi:MAG TPA: polysaccharide deacetylase family protein [Rhizomicrobium sp.]|nr:polysaccharide deacetylase family protein [Rhizomicrobium sp.]